MSERIIKVDSKLGNCPQFRGAVVVAAKDGNKKLVEAGLEVASLMS